MKSSTERATDALIEALSQSDGDDFAQAREMLAHEGLDVLRHLAVAALVSAARQTRRRITLAAERRAARPVAARSDRPDQETWPTDEARERWRREDEEAQERHYARLNQLISDYTDSVRTAWTAELLGSTFTMKDGRVVTWGEATIEDHEERMQMFSSNARAAVEGAARHQQAIADLRAEGAPCLRELVGAAQVAS